MGTSVTCSKEKPSDSRFDKSSLASSHNYLDRLFNSSYLLAEIAIKIDFSHGAVVN
jgi:hypothetical protein